MSGKVQTGNQTQDKKNRRRPVLMITPFHQPVRGNAVTASRIRAGMEGLGWPVDFCSLDAIPQRRLLQQWANSGDRGLIHGFHALHTGKTIVSFRGLERYPLLLTMTGTDLMSLRAGKDMEVITPVLNRAAAIVVFNDNFRSFLNSLSPVWGKKTVLIPQGVALKDGRAVTRKAFGLSESELVFILPSGLRAIKNIDMAVDAINMVNKSGAKAKLLIVGPIIEQDYAERLLKRCENNPQIKYLGVIEHTEMKPLLLITDVVINCSRSEGQPQAALEAMSLGKPCLLTAVPGNLNIIENYKEGLYVRDASDLAAAMEYCLREPEKRSAMGLAARELVAKQFGADREIDMYNDLYVTIQRV